MEEEDEEEVGILVSDEGAAEVVPRFNLRRLWPEGLHCHRVDTGLNSGGCCSTVPDDTFIYVLKCFFLTALGLCVLNGICLGLFMQKDMFQNDAYPLNLIKWLFVSDEAGWRVVTLLAVFAAVVCVRAFIMKLKKTSGSASSGKEEKQTTSASIQHV